MQYCLQIFVNQPGNEVKLLITQNTGEVRLYKSQIQRYATLLFFEYCFKYHGFTVALIIAQILQSPRLKPSGRIDWITKAYH